MIPTPGRSRTRQRARHGSHAFAPVQLSGCALWLAADFGVTTSGAAVTAWTNRGSAGGTVSQGTAGARPTYQATGFGATSMPYLSCDGGDYLESTASSLVTAGSALTVFVVCSHNASAGGGLFAIRRSTRFLSAIELVAGGIHYASSNGVDAGANIVLAAGSLNGITSAHVARWSFGGAGQAPVYASNGTAATTSSGTQGTETGATGFMVGGVQPAAQYLTGRLAEVIVYVRALTANEALLVERYLGARYGIAVA